MLVEMGGQAKMALLVVPVDIMLAAAAALVISAPEAMVMLVAEAKVVLAAAAAAANLLLVLLVAETAAVVALPCSGRITQMDDLSPHDCQRPTGKAHQG